MQNQYPPVEAEPLNVVPSRQKQKRKASTSRHSVILKQKKQPDHIDEMSQSLIDAKDATIQDLREANSELN